jgi:hypothetical protein
MSQDRESIWQLVAKCAAQLTDAGRTPFTRGQLIECIQLFYPQYSSDSINPIIQGLTDNAKSGAPSAAGKTLLHRVARGQYVLLGVAKERTRTVSSFKLRFPESEIVEIAKRYSYERQEKSLVADRKTVERAGHLTKKQLKDVALWKAPRAAGHIDKNGASFVEEMTHFALTATDERARIEILTLIDGVQWPTASVILHLYHKDRYPILDFRALWSLGQVVPKVYTFEYWWPYVEFCRGLADHAKVDMRTLDRALWQYSKENQSPGTGLDRPEYRNQQSAGTARKATNPLRPRPADTRNAVYWVSCVSQKLDRSAAAKDLYVSSLFFKARSYVESNNAPWWILSAKYGLVSPDDVIAPYDQTLNQMAVADRRRWANKVVSQLAEQPIKPQCIVLLAGARYREFLEPKLKAMGIEVLVPMKGLRIGEQLSWLGSQ